MYFTFNFFINNFGGERFGNAFTSTIVAVCLQPCLLYIFLLCKQTAKQTQQKPIHNLANYFVKLANPTNGTTGYSVETLLRKSTSVFLVFIINFIYTFVLHLKHYTMNSIIIEPKDKAEFDFFLNFNKKNESKKQSGKRNPL